MAVMKDDEVDRLERAGAQSASSRQDVMESMYGRLDPKPLKPTYSLEEQKKMKEKEVEERVKARSMMMLSSSYQQIGIPTELGLDCKTYKWKQNQTYVEIFIPIQSEKIDVDLKPKFISVEINERPLLKGELYRDIKAEESTWYVQDGVLEIILLKLSRRGQYANGETNADTYWRAVLKSPREEERLQLENPPSSYYKSHFELDVNSGGSQKLLKSGKTYSKKST